MREYEKIRYANNKKKQIKAFMSDQFVCCWHINNKKSPRERYLD